MCKQRPCRTPEVPLSARLLEVAIARRLDFGPSASEHILRRPLADGAVQTHTVL